MEKLNIPLPLYRAIPVNNFYGDKMIEGNIVVTTCNGHTDIDILSYELDVVEGIAIRPETLGVYICKEDMNAKNIFTADVLKHEFNVDGKMKAEHCLVYWDKDACAIKLLFDLKKSPIYYVNDVIINQFEIIGNIHENPELLKLFPQLQEVPA